ncbi:MAG TPA: hypothetical protein VFW90_00895 [Candidatus Saccharimonadales bacterium]|nr:hypothetical protein [Candidatus Saccharimonadales bacterium]
MPEEKRVFDVTRPSRVSPQPASRPVIVGHRPMAVDPMVKEKTSADSPSPPSGHELLKGSGPTQIKVEDGTANEPLEAVPETEPPASPKSVNIQPPADAESSDKETSDNSPAIFITPDGSETKVLPEENNAPEESAVPPSSPEPPTAEEPDTESPADGETPSDEDSGDPAPLPNIEPLPQVESPHMSHPKRRMGGLKWVLLVILIVLVGGYLAIDSGLINTGINLPFHIFKQKQPSTAVTAPPPPSGSSASNNQNTASSGPVAPAGFKIYNITDTNINFAAPLSWGSPTSKSESGYTKRGDGSKPDGTYAYLVHFPKNKDVEIAVTSNKYLPVTRGTLYYDYLQWCTGTNDGQIYEAILDYTTAGKVDTPSTVVCNQGPVSGAEKLDDTTIVQARAKNTDGKVIGDIYTKNLTDPSLAVFRVKDTSMNNGDDIKQILDTVQVSSSSTSSQSNS